MFICLRSTISTRNVLHDAALWIRKESRRLSASYSTAHNQIDFISGSGAVALRFRLIYISSLFHHISLYLITLCIARSLLRRRVTRRLTRLQTMRNVLKYSKIVQNVSVRWRFGCGYFFNLLMFSTVFQSVTVAMESHCFWCA